MYQDKTQEKQGERNRNQGFSSDNPLFKQEKIHPKY
ncbi:hypothetical protein SGO_1350 [Streptococcus gordonii str. Challis substr. CH1]|uniref:Uncharacterized protein n=1 Tax=Streptococcus gordonii (strain Challis / ATCC 35105 / BCRC 15272 / CH1 / DL1 / V288) TaxID=467705 RepID=A8AXX1_STRGC|nr:hypothetical protein SGO_1350 [Streptococcus gordonii str. Challis substr. CH1]